MREITLVAALYISHLLDNLLKLWPRKCKPSLGQQDQIMIVEGKQWRIL